MDLLPEKIPWGIIVGLGVLAFVWVVIAEKLDKAHFGIKNASGPTPGWSPMPNTGRRPSTMYHGTKYLEWGKDILLNNRWKIGSSGGVYMAEDFNQAYQYSGIGGAIVELYVSPKANLSNGVKSALSSF